MKCKHLLGVTKGYFDVVTVKELDQMGSTYKSSTTEWEIAKSRQYPKVNKQPKAFLFITVD
jgi:hypothetical protein